MRKAVWICLPFTAAIALCHYLLPDNAVVLLLLCCGVLSLAALLLQGKKKTALLLLSLGVALGSVRYWTQLQLAAHPGEALVGSSLTVSARVVDFPDIYESGTYVTVRLTEPGLPGVKCRLVSYEPGELDSFTPGDKIVCAVRFSSAAMRSGEETDAYTSQGIFVRAVCRETPTAAGKWTFSFLYLPLRLGRMVAEKCREVFPADAGGFMTALLTGEKAALYEDGSYYSLSEAGLAHIVSVSGMHIAFLTGFLFHLTGRRRSSILLSFPVMLFFAAMTGFTPSVTRAVFMQICLLSAPLFSREEDAVTSLSLVLALILLVNPMAVGGASLQLSFASMAGIWLVSGGIYRRLLDLFSDKKIYDLKLGKIILSFLCGTFSAGVGAMLFSLPLAAAHFGYVSTVSPISGLLCLWIVSLLYIGGFFTVAVGFFLPAAAAAAGRVLAWGVRYILFVSNALGYLPCETVYLSNPVFLLWFIFAYAVFLLWWFRNRKGSLRPVAPVCLVLIALYASAMLVRLSWSDDIRVSAVDVGQGECVVVTSGSRAIMVDCGGSTFPRSAGENAVRFLASRQRRHLDALILTHLHSDHVNGVSRLLSQVRVDVIYLPLQADEDGTLPDILAAADKYGVRVEYVTENFRLILGELDVTVWSPILSGEENENCLIVMAAQEGFEAVITGDSLSAAERIFSALYELPDTEVLVVGHHGSATSTTDRFLRELRPDLALISVGYNTYGHPSPAVLDRLEEYGIPVLRTDLEGDITVKPERRAANG